MYTTVSKLSLGEGASFKTALRSILLPLGVAILLLGRSDAFVRPDLDFRDAVFYALLCPLAFLLSVRQIGFRGNIFLFAGLFLLTVGLLSVFHAGRIHREGLVSWSQYLLWFLLALAATAWTEDDFSRLRRMSVLAAVGVSIGLISHCVWIPNPLPFSPGHPTYMSHFLAINTLLLLGCNRGNRPTMAAPLVLLVTALLICGTRSSFVALFVGAILLHGTSAPTRRWKTAAVSIAIAIGVVTYFHWTVRDQIFTHRFDIANWNDFTSGRWDIYSRTIAMIAEKPFWGWGIGRFAFDYPKFSGNGNVPYWTMHPHNEVLHVLSELGIFGFTAVLGAILTFWIWLRRTAQQATGTSRLGWAGMALILVEWQFSTCFTIAVSRFYFAVFLGMAVYGLKKNKLGIPTRLAVLWVPVLTIAYSVIASDLVSIVYLRKAQTTASEFLQLEYARKAYAFSPAAFQPLYSLTDLENRIFSDPSPHASELEETFPNMPQAKRRR